jgi:hypothetical protein
VPSTVADVTTDEFTVTVTLPLSNTPVELPGAKFTVKLQ